MHSRCLMPGMRPLAWVLGLTALALAGCATQDATGSASSAAIEGGAGSQARTTGLRPFPRWTAARRTTARRTTPPIADRQTPPRPATPQRPARARCTRSRSQSFSGQATADAYWTPSAPRECWRSTEPATCTWRRPSMAASPWPARSSIRARGRACFVVKVDPACKVLWAKAFGASESGVSLAGLAADGAGNVVVAADLSGHPVDFGTGPIGPAMTSSRWASCSSSARTAMASGATPIRARSSRTPTSRWWMSPSTRTGTRCSWQAWRSAGRSGAAPHVAGPGIGRFRRRGGHVRCVSRRARRQRPVRLQHGRLGLGVGGQFSPQNLR